MYKSLSVYCMYSAKKLKLKAVNNVIKSPQIKNNLHCLHISTKSVPITMWSASHQFKQHRKPPSSVRWLLRHLIGSAAPTGPGSANTKKKGKNASLHHFQWNPVRCHRPRLNRNPQVLCIVRIFFPLRLRPRSCHGVSAAATAAVGMATAAAVAAHRHSDEEDQQGKREEDHQADGVVNPLVVFFVGEPQDLVEEILNAVNSLIHGFRIQNCGSFLIESAAVLKFLMDLLESFEVYKIVNKHKKRLLEIPKIIKIFC